MIYKNSRAVVIIINWNGKEYLRDCLESLEKQSFKNFSVIVIDNGSTDDSVDFIKRKYPSITIILLDDNYGFAKANNIGIKKSLKISSVEYIVLLNNDTKVHPDFLKTIINCADTSNAEAGAFAPKIYQIDNPNILDSTGREFRYGLLYNRGENTIDKGQYDRKKSIEGIHGAACLLKKTMLEDIGLFKESYISYNEDTELALRARKKGWKSFFVPASIVYHKGGGTAKKTKEIQTQMVKLSLKNSVITLKEYGCFIQRLKYAFYLFYLGIRSWLGKKKKRNLVGGKPYFKTIVSLFT